MKIRHQIQTEQGGIRLTLFLIIAMGMCFWIGGQGTYTALKNRQPTTLGCQDLPKAKPTAHWLALTNCELHVANSAYMIRKSKYDATGKGRITEAFVPIHVPGQSDDAQCYAVMATKDSTVLALLEELRNTRSETEATAFFVKHARELQVQRDVKGLIRFGVEEQNGERSKLAGLRSNLAPDYLLLAEGEEPSLARSALLLVLGFGIGAGLVMMLRAKAEPSTE